MAGPSVIVSRTRNGSGGLFLDHSLLVRRLAAAARTLGEGGLDLLDRLGLGDALHRRDFAREPVERRFVELTLAVGLLGLRFGADQIPNHFRDGDDVPRIDLRLVYLSTARPHGALDPGTALEGLQGPLDD